ncbi:MAG: CIA30 family protein [Methylobacter sp.]|jgi:monofunctional biosynthetic peptidoglycan transglycosylase|nr:CIA30 family protein [Methylobacter sp.]
MIIDFTDVDESQRWIAINDGVMGGISQSGLQLSSTATGIFSGRLCLENNGGFASIRRPSDDYHLKDCSGIMLNVKGDGRTYQFRLKTDDQYDGIAYRTLFTTDAQNWQTLALPFNCFCASFRGRLIPNAPVLDPEKIRQIGFLLADKQQGDFCLEIASIKSF